MIIPAYNRAAEIGVAIASVLGQSFADFELIVVDDLSTDGTMAAVEAIGDPRLRVVRRAANGGPGAARNPSPLPVYLACRGFVSIARSFPEINLAIFFVKVFGFRPFAVFLALSVATVGLYAKLLAEDIEAIDPAQAEAVRATGSSWFQ